MQNKINSKMINNRKSPIQDDYIEKYLAEKELNVCLYDYYKKDGMGESGKIEAKKRVYSTD